LEAARELSEQIIETTRKCRSRCPAKLRVQVTSSAQSISANIAEGVGRGTPKEKLHFFRLARGSLEETQNHLRVLVRVGVIDRKTFYRLWNRAKVIGRMLSTLIAGLERRS
jgi:four helix bundle protein